MLSIKNLIYQKPSNLLKNWQRKFLDKLLNIIVQSTDMNEKFSKPARD